MTAEDLAASEMNFVVSITGLDETSAQLLHAGVNIRPATCASATNSSTCSIIDEQGQTTYRLFARSTTPGRLRRLSLI